MEYADVYNINLYGDPSLKLEGYPTGIGGWESSGAGPLVELDTVNPNPFTTACSIGYYLSTPCSVQLAIFDLQGRRLTCLRDGFMTAGSHTEVWEPDGVPDGVYFVRITAGHQSAVQRVLLLE
jgi:hypothetical protein